MAAGGYFNHYDDPDEFWDDEPVVPTPSPAPTAPAVGADLGLVTMCLDNDRLPVDMPTATKAPTDRIGDIGSCDYQKRGEPGPGASPAHASGHGWRLSG